MIAAMFGAALRVSEALALRPSDLDLDAGMVRVRHGKGDRARTAIDPTAQAYVERWLARRDALGLNGRQPLFCTITRNDRLRPPLTPPTSAVSYHGWPTERASSVASTHALRHSLATALAHEGKTLPAISAQLGHSSTAVTDRYLRRIAPTDLAAAVRDRGRLT